MPDSPEELSARLQAADAMFTGSRAGTSASPGTSVLADRGYDSDPLRKRLAARGLRLVAARRRDRTESRSNDGQRLRRLHRRWVVERTIGWLKQFRRLNVRWEYYSVVFHDFAQLAWLAVAARRF